MGNSSHVILFPFMSKGHTIPLLHLAKLIHIHRPAATFTVFTTTANRLFISDTLSSTIPPNLLSIVSFPFPSHPLIPPGLESTDKLPSMHLFHPFLEATLALQPVFESALNTIYQNAPTATCVLISDGFLYWTQEHASRLHIPRLVYYGMGSYAHTICRVAGDNRSLFGLQGADDELVQLPHFPRPVKVAKNYFSAIFTDSEPKGPHYEFVVKTIIATSKSYGLLVNSFYGIDSMFLDHWNSNYEPKAWPIGPFCLVDKPMFTHADKPTPAWIQWLDRKLVEGKSVLYAAFGSQAEISDEQLKELVVGLEESEVDFLWALRIKPEQEDIVYMKSERGLVVSEWLDQREVLKHESVCGFLSHCGWNSVIESICAGVPILAWPMSAEQPLNARFVVDEIKVGLRAEICDGFVKAEGLSKTVKDLMGGVAGMAVSQRVKELSEDAKKAMEEGGTSWSSLELLLNELEAK